MKMASPSFQELLARSKVRGVEAIVKSARAVPSPIQRSSGSAVRFPVIVMIVSPLIVWFSFRLGDSEMNRIVGVDVVFGV